MSAGHIEPVPNSTGTDQSKMDVIERSILGLTGVLESLDAAGLSMAAIFVEQALENLRQERGTL